MLNSDNYTIYNTQPKALLSFIGTGKKYYRDLACC